MDWYIYLHLPSKLSKCRVYIPYMDPMGIVPTRVETPYTWKVGSMVIGSMAYIIYLYKWGIPWG